MKLFGDSHTAGYSLCVLDLGPNVLGSPAEVMVIARVRVTWVVVTVLASLVPTLCLSNLQASLRVS